MNAKILLGLPIAFGVGYGSTLVWQFSLESLLRNAGAKVIASQDPEALWIGGVFVLGYLAVFLLQRFRAEFRDVKKILMVYFFSWIGANLGVMVQAMGIASKELPKQLAENAIPTINMSAYPYVNWASFGLVSGLFLVGLLVFFTNLLQDSEDFEDSEN